MQAICGLAEQTARWFEVSSATHHAGGRASQHVLEQARPSARRCRPARRSSSASRFRSRAASPRRGGSSSSCPRCPSRRARARARSAGAGRRRPTWRRARPSRERRPGREQAHLVGDAEAPRERAQPGELGSASPGGIARAHAGGPRELVEEQHERAAAGSPQTGRASSRWNSAISSRAAATSCEQPSPASAFDAAVGDEPDDRAGGAAPPPPTDLAGRRDARSWRGRAPAGAPGSRAAARAAGAARRSRGAGASRRSGLKRNARSERGRSSTARPAARACSSACASRARADGSPFVSVPARVVRSATSAAAIAASRRSHSRSGSGGRRKAATASDTTEPTPVSQMRSTA